MSTQTNKGGPGIQADKEETCLPGGSHLIARCLAATSLVAPAGGTTGWTRAGAQPSLAQSLPPPLTQPNDTGRVTPPL